MRVLRAVVALAAISGAAANCNTIQYTLQSKAPNFELDPSGFTAGGACTTEGMGALSSSGPSNAPHLCQDGYWNKVPTVLRAGVTVTVAKDGTGDYTTLQDAIGYVTSLASDRLTFVQPGAFTIQLKDGTYNEDGVINIDASVFQVIGAGMQSTGADHPASLPILDIVGTGIEGVVISSTSTAELFHIYGPNENYMRFRSLKMVGPSGGTALRLHHGSRVALDIVQIAGATYGIAGDASIPWSAGSVDILGAATSPALHIRNSVISDVVNGLVLQEDLGPGTGATWTIHIADTRFTAASKGTNSQNDYGILVKGSSVRVLMGNGVVIDGFGFGISSQQGAVVTARVGVANGFQLLDTSWFGLHVINHGSVYLHGGNDQIVIETHTNQLWTMMSDANAFIHIVGAKFDCSRGATQNRILGSGWNSFTYGVHWNLDGCVNQGGLASGWTGGGFRLHAIRNKPAGIACSSGWECSE